MKDAMQEMTGSLAAAKEISAESAEATFYRKSGICAFMEAVFSLWTLISLGR